MIDTELKPMIEKALTGLAQTMVAKGFDANMVTMIGAAMAVPAFIALAIGAYPLALIFILLNRFCDGLDGVVAKHQKGGPTQYGRYLDMLLDILFFVGAILFFILGRPDILFIGAFFMFGVLCVMVTPILLEAIRPVREAPAPEIQQPKKPLANLTNGLVEGFEMTMALIFICLFPSGFVAMAVIFGTICWVAVFMQISKARRILTPPI